MGVVKGNYDGMGGVDFKNLRVDKSCVERGKGKDQKKNINKFRSQLTCGGTSVYLPAFAWSTILSILRNAPLSWSVTMAGESESLNKKSGGVKEKE